MFSNEGIGTLVYANEYQQIRRARRSDVRAIEQLIRSSIESEELAPRTRASIERELGDYYIFEVDKNPIACVALHVYAGRRARASSPASTCGRSHENHGIGRKMVQFVEQKAREGGLETLLALSTQAFNYFQSKAGFVEGTPDDLPPERRGTLRRERASLEGAGQEAVVSWGALRRAPQTPRSLRGSESRSVRSPLFVAVAASHPLRLPRSQPAGPHPRRPAFGPSPRGRP